MYVAVQQIVAQHYEGALLKEQKYEYEYVLPCHYHVRIQSISILMVIKMSAIR